MKLDLEQRREALRLLERLVGDDIALEAAIYTLVGFRAALEQIDAKAYANHELAGDIARKALREAALS